MYRMSLTAFQKLTRTLGKDIIVVEVYCPVDEPSIPEIVVAVGIVRYLSGSKCLDLKTAYGLSLSSVYRCSQGDLFIVAVNASPELDIKMPTTLPEIANVATDFSAVSTANLVRGCVFFIDGILGISKRPTMKESSGDPRSFYSDHYDVYGLNVQAVCDVNCRFLFFGVVAPGKCGDQVAFECTPIFE